MSRKKKGFTLIEMLVVIAIIAILVAIVIPTVTSATTKARAATDAANLRSVLGYMNAVLMTEEMEIDVAVQNYDPPKSKLHPNSKLYILYTIPGVIDVYYIDGSNYYGLDYLADIAVNGTSSIDPSVEPVTSADDTWYKVGPAA